MAERSRSEDQSRTTRAKQSPGEASVEPRELSETLIIVISIFGLIGLWLHHQPGAPADDDR